MSKNTVNPSCQCQRETKRHSPTCFEWIQLLVTFSVPVAIALYTFLQNNNEQSIALANREKDLEIARKQRVQDLQIADDQQKANILAVYESFLIDHLNRYDTTLNESTSAKFIARLKTLTTVSQLDPTRKIFLIQSVSEAKLIVNDNNTSDHVVLVLFSLEEADLSEIAFENRRLKYLSLPKSNLTRAIFAFVDLSCINFYWTVLINTDFQYASILTTKNQCFLKFSHTIFYQSNND